MKNLDNRDATKSYCECGHGWSTHQSNGRADWYCDITDCDCLAYAPRDNTSPQTVRSAEGSLSKSPTSIEELDNIDFMFTWRVTDNPPKYEEKILECRIRLTDKAKQAITALIEAERIALQEAIASTETMQTSDGKWWVRKEVLEHKLDRLAELRKGQKNGK